MENDYGVGVSNRYEVFLEEEEDPLEMLRNQEQLKEAKKKTKLQEKENRNTGNKVEPSKGKPTVQTAKKQIKETQNLKSVEVSKSKEDAIKTPRGPRQAPTVKFAPESREERNNRRNREDRISAPNDTREGRESREPRNYDGDGEGRGRGRGGVGRGRGRGSWRGSSGGANQSGEFRPKREFDRHSGSDKSGVKPVDKRDGGGAHNWGTYRDEINEQLDSSYLSQENQDWSPDKTNPDQAVLPSTPTDAPTDAKDVDTSEGEGQTNAEDSPAKELTLDEWKALRGHRQKPQFNIRKAGEGEDPSQWKKMYALNKKKEGEEEEDEDEEYEIAEYPQRVGRQKHLLEIDIHFSDSRRGGRMRGGSRGGPGRGGMGGRGGSGGGAGGDSGPRERSGPIGSERSNETTTRSEHPPESERYERDMRESDSFDPFERGGRGSRGSRGRGGRGGRGGPNFYANNTANQPSSGPTRGRGSYNRQHQSAPKVDDEKDFPSLG